MITWIENFCIKNFRFRLDDFNIYTMVSQIREISKEEFEIPSFWELLSFDQNKAKFSYLDFFSVKRREFDWIDLSPLSTI